MEEEDNEFFILVAGVLAAIILVVSWWYMSGGTNVPVATSAPAVEATAEAEPEDDVAEAEPAATPQPTAEPEPEPTAVPAAPAAPSTVFEVLAADSELSVVTDLVRSQNLDSTLSDTGPFTVFAPSNDAVDTALASDTTSEVLDANASGVLAYHVVTGEYSFDDLVEIAEDDANTLVTVAGEPIDLSLDGDNLVVNGSTVIVGDPQTADNGVVHTIDNVLLPPITALNAIVGQEPILFASGSAEIEQESFATLDQFIDILGSSNVDVSIEGHTDSSGDPVLNQNLSQSRARSVLNYLVAAGIDESRLSATGFGSANPVADNDTEEGRALNRRIEFSLN